MNRIFARQVTIFVTALMLSVSPCPVSAAKSQDSDSSSIDNEKLSLHFRYRYEFVDQAGFINNAQASTLRTRLAYRSRDISNFGFEIEFDDVRSVGDDRYNSTRNGNTNRPVIADPEGTDVNRALILYKGLQGTIFRVGRQRITLDNHRFIGDVGWRQNDQTYDGLSMTNSSLPKMTFNYAYLDRVNRIFGPSSGVPSANFQSDSHVLNAKYELLPNLDVSAYAYWLDLRDAPASSSKTFGIRASGSLQATDRTSLRYTLEYAHQNNYRDNPNRYNADYVLLDAALTNSGITWRLGYEVLAGHPAQAFQTPLGTLHAFQGWTDKFLTTPAGGVEDLYFSASTKIHEMDFSLVHHRFSPEAGGTEYGREWGLLAKKPLSERYLILLKYASYDAGDFASDTQKVWVMLNAKLGN